MSLVEASLYNQLYLNGLDSSRMFHSYLTSIYDTPPANYSTHFWTDATKTTWEFNRPIDGLLYDLDSGFHQVSLCSIELGMTSLFDFVPPRESAIIFNIVRKKIDITEENIGGRFTMFSTDC